MELSFASLMPLVRESFRAPKVTFAQILALAPSLEARVLAAAAVTVLSALIGHLANILFPVPMESAFTWATTSPLRLLLIQGLMICYTVAAVTVVGRMFRGTGKAADALLLVVWIEFILLILQAVQLVMMVLFPLVATLAGIASVGLFFWLLTQVVAVLHGFKKLPLIFLGILGTIFISALALSFLLSLLGFPALEM
ncbi:YIP1 family protein [Phaeovulum sp. W22_SRMD_FR3]|uniref:YIP1 family protein n=1 Tax=Phaeovulum sp. W22_SRMD_FR3 TaxID=3240274 RepID=UPI003F95833B